MAYIFQYIHKKWKGSFLIKWIYILYHHDLAMLYFYPIFIVKYFNILFRSFFTPFCCCSIYILKVKFCFKYKSKTGYTHQKSNNENVSWIKKYKFNKKYFMLNIHFFLSWLFHHGGRYHIETSPLTCGANQWTGLYMITASVMKELRYDHFLWIEKLDIMKLYLFHTISFDWIEIFFIS